MNGYIIVLPEGVLTSEQRAERISRELYCVTAPLATQEPYQHDGKVFGMVEHPDGVQFALQVDTEYNIPGESIGDVRTAYIAYDGTYRNRSAAVVFLRSQLAIVSVWGYRSKYNDGEDI